MRPFLFQLREKIVVKSVEKNSRSLKTFVPYDQGAILEAR
jgi:hypothetical protein